MGLSSFEINVSLGCGLQGREDELWEKATRALVLVLLFLADAADL